MKDIFIGRQPIFDRNFCIQAYELLYRHSEVHNYADITDGDRSTSSVLVNSLFEMGIENLVGKHRGFINLTQYFLENPELVVFPPGKVVIEVLENVKPSKELVLGIQKLKELGHTIALDDYSCHPDVHPLVKLADIIKIDVLASSRDAIERTVAQLLPMEVELLAEKIETHEQFEWLEVLGFQYFQGYFFAKPKIVKGKALPLNQQSILRLLAQINAPNVDINELANLVRTNLVLSHKIMKFLNSPMSGISSKVDSVQKAVILLGLRRLKNWASIFAMTGQENTSMMLTFTSIKRARFCELLAQSNRLSEPESFFTVGLFSILDAIMGFPLEELIQEMALSDTIRDGLVDKTGPCGDALKCVLMMESNEFEELRFYGSELSDLSKIHLEAIKWAEEVSEDSLALKS